MLAGKGQKSVTQAGESVAASVPLLPRGLTPSW